jgi:hypothetical protein
MAYELFADSFDTSASILASRWSSSNAAIVSGEGRHGSSALRLQNQLSTSAIASTIDLAPFTHAVCGFSLKLPASIATPIVFQFRNASTVLVAVSVATTGRLSVTLGGTTYESTSVLTFSATHHIQIGVVIGDSGSLQVKVNDSSAGWLDLSGVDTKPSTTANCTNFSFFFSYSYPTSNSYFDDFTLTYGDELVWLGDVRVDALALAGDATPQDWTPDSGNAWERLNADAGYIESDTVDDESRFNLADYTGTTTGIKAVVVNASAKKTDAGSRSFAIEVDSGGTVSVGSTRSLGDSTQEYREVYLTDPDTGAAWNDSGVDALIVGVKVVA